MTRLLLASCLFFTGCAEGAASRFAGGFARGAASEILTLPPTEQEEKDARFEMYWDLKCDEILKRAKSEGITRATLQQRMPLFRDGLCSTKRRSL